MSALLRTVLRRQVGPMLFDLDQTRALTGDRGAEERGFWRSGHDGL